jgi:hypothetical protein
VALIPLVIPLVYFAFNALYALLAPPAGGLSDRIGQRRRGGTALGTQRSGGAQRSGDQGPPTARPTHRSTASRSASTAPTAGGRGGVAQHGGVVQGAADQGAAVPGGVGVGAPPEEEPHAQRVGLPIATEKIRSIPGSGGPHQGSGGQAVAPRTARSAGPRPYRSPARQMAAGAPPATDDKCSVPRGRRAVVSWRRRALGGRGGGPAPDGRGAGGTGRAWSREGRVRPGGGPAAG